MAENQEGSLAEDLLLLLFQPTSGLRPGEGTIAGENTLFYVLGGAVLADLAMSQQVATEPGRGGTTLVKAVESRPPADDTLRPAWEYVLTKPREVQTVLAGVGPSLRDPLLDRLVERDDLRRSSRKMLGLFTTTVLEEGGTGRRTDLLAEVRAALVDGAEPRPRVAALAALISASGNLHRFDPEIPWTSPIIARAKELEQGNWGAEAAAQAVTRTVTAVIANSVVTAIVVAPQQ